MKKKYMIAGIMCGFFIISGICYSCAYQKDNKAAVLLSSNEQEDAAEVGSETDQDKEQLKSAELSKSKKQMNSTDEAGSATASNNGLSEDLKEVPTTEDPSTDTEDLIYIHICGAVTNPGVYQAESGARLIDILKLSGGLDKEAAGDYMNQAMVVEDGQRIYIPTREEVEKLSPEEYIKGNGTAAQDQTTDKGLVNINTAGKQELMDLPGIGQAKADSIIEYRGKIGSFQKAEELMDIPGIKEGLFDQISSYITIK